MLVVNNERMSMAPDGIGRDVCEVGVVGGKSYVPTSETTRARGRC